MIQPSEYRLGNIVCWNPALTSPGNTLPHMYLEIASIHSGKIGYFTPSLEHRAEAFQDDLLQTETPYKDLEEVEPVLLTTEIALQAGFVNGRLDLPAGTATGALVLSNDGLHYQDSSGQQINFAVKYLHQLQNLYFALTGKELAVSL